MKLEVEYLCFSLLKNIGKNISKCLSGKWIQNLLGHTKQSPTDSLKTVSEKQFEKQQKQANLSEFSNTVQLMCREVIQKLNHKQMKNQHKKKDIYIYPEKRKRITDKLRLI